MSGDLAAFIAARLDDWQAEIAESVSFAEPGCALPGLHLDPCHAERLVAAGRGILHRARRYEQMQLAGDATAADMAAAGAAHRALRYLAAVWSDHADYRPEWQFDVRLPIR